MTFQAAPDVAAVTFNMLSFDSPWAMTFHVDCLHAPTDSDLAGIATVFANWWEDDLVTVSSANNSPVSVVVTDISQEGGHQFTHSSWTSTFGAEAGDSVPLSVCAVVSWRSAQIGRSYRGRTYWTAFARSHVVENAIAVAYQSSLEAAFSQLQPLLAAEAFALVILSRFHDKVKRATAISVGINSMHVATPIGTQRRRIQA